MEIKKISEKWNRTFDAEGKSEDKLESVKYTVSDNSGTDIGEANIDSGSGNASFSVGGASVGINIYNFDGIAEGEAALKAIFGIE